MKIKFKGQKGVARYKEDGRWVRVKVIKDQELNLNDKTAAIFVKSGLWSKSESKQTKKDIVEEN